MRSKWKTTVGSLSSWSTFTIAWITAIRLFVALVSDPNRTQNFSPLWFVLWVITTVEMFAFVLLVMSLGFKKKLLKKPAPIANLILVGLAGVIANVTVGLLANAWGLDSKGIWHIRAIGGFFSFILMFVLLNNLRRAMVERNENIRALSEVEDELLGYRESAKQILHDSQESLRSKTIATLSPTIEKINQLLAAKVDNATRLELIEELRLAIQEQVRPISRSLADRAEALSVPIVRTVHLAKVRPNWQAKFNLYNSIKILPALALIVFGYPLVAFLVIDSRSMFRGLLSALAVGGVVFLLKQLVPRNREFKTYIGLLLQALFATLGVIPAVLIQLGEYGPTPQVFNMTIWMIGMSVAGFFLSGYTRSVDAARDRYEESLRAFNDTLAKEVSLFEQKLWLERRAWSYVLHGDVQGALSAAATRLQQSDQLEPYEFEMVKQTSPERRAPSRTRLRKTLNLAKASTNWCALGPVFVKSKFKLAPGLAAPWSRIAI